MNPPNNPPEWNRLVSAARRASPDTGDAAAPYGFATRVAAQAMARESGDASLLLRYSLRALGVACLLMVASVAANITPILHAIDEETAALSESALMDADTGELS
jgi:hypothetical protein